MENPVNKRCLLVTSIIASLVWAGVFVTVFELSLSIKIYKRPGGAEILHARLTSSFRISRNKMHFYGE